MVRSVPLAWFSLLAACSSPNAPGAAPSGGPVPSAAMDWQPSDGDLLVQGFARQCLKESSWADSFREARGRAPVVRVGEVTTAAQDGATITDTLAGQIEKTLLDSGQVQVAASVNALAELQELQSLRLLSSQATEPAAGADLSSDYVLTVQVTATSSTTRDGTVRVFSGAFRVVNSETGGVDCVAMATSKKLVARED